MVGTMEINSLDFISKYKDLLANGVEVDPTLAKAQSLFLNRMVVNGASTVGLFLGTAHYFSLLGPSDVFKKTLTLLSLISEDAPVVIKSDCLPLIKELTGVTSFYADDEAWHYIHTLLCSHFLELRCKNTSTYPRSDDDLCLRVNRKMPPFLKSREPKMFKDLWDELSTERFLYCDDVLLEHFFTTTPFYYLDYDDVRGVGINVTRRG